MRKECAGWCMNGLRKCARCGKSLPDTAFGRYQTSGDRKTGAWRLRKTCKACMRQKWKYYTRIHRAKIAAAEEEMEARHSMTEQEGRANCMKTWAWLYERWQA